MPAPTTTCRSRSTPPSSSPPCGRGCRSTGPPTRSRSRPRPRTGTDDARRRARRRPLAPGCRATSTGLKILVVDDDFRNIFAMTALLERGHAVVHRRRERRRGDRRPGADARHRHRPDGHHDAGHGRLRHHARHPGDRRSSRRCRSSPSPARPRPASASAASMPAPTTTSPSRSTPASCSPRSSPWLPTSARPAA